MVTLPDVSTDILERILAVILGFGVYLVFSHPKYWKKKIPKFHLGAIEILPNFKIKLKNQTIHVHHWIWLSAILGYLNHIAHGIDNLLFLKLFATGGIIQGFTFKDKFNVFIKTAKPKKHSQKNTGGTGKLKSIHRIAAYIIIASIILATFFGNLFTIKPVKAEVLITGRHLKNHLITTVKHRLSQADNKIDHLNPARTQNN